MKKRKYGTLKNPIVRINPSLDKYNDIEQSSEKHRKATERLAKIGLPKMMEQKKS